jgi:hypothetical protein
MSDLPARNRVIYQSEALFISPDCTGYHMYYMPPYAVTGETDASNCLVQGTDEAGAPIFFDACMGRVVDDTSLTYSNGADLKFKTFECTGLATGNGSTTPINPILSAAGFKTITTEAGEGGLKHLNHEEADHPNSPWGTVIDQIKRVQSANYSFTINRQDINQFGHLGRLDSVVLESPTVSLDYSYYLTDGYNERLLGFINDGSIQSMSGMMTRDQNEFGNNYFILTVPEGRDAVLGDQLVEENDKTVIGLGNAYITDYSIEASVGAFPTASVTVEGMNIKSDIGTQFKAIPAVDPQDGTLLCDTCFSLPPSETGAGASILKPGDITLSLNDAALISKQISGNALGYGAEDEGSAHIQSFSLSKPLSRTNLQRLGNTYAYAKEVDYPVTCTLTVNALVADLKEGNLLNLLCDTHHDLKIRMQHPQCIGCDANDAPDAIVIDFKKALLDSESFSSSIGDNKSVDLTFTTQIGGPEQGEVGIFFSGFENQKGADNKYKRPPSVKNGTYHEYGHNGTTGHYDGRQLTFSSDNDALSESFVSTRDRWSSELKDRTKDLSS